MQQITFDSYRDKYWRRIAGYAFAAAHSKVQIVAAELPQAAVTMPLAFAQQNDMHVLVGVLSPTSGENLYVSPEGRWLGAYIPAILKGYPFKLGVDGDSGQPCLCIDEDAGWITSDKNSGNPFFDDTGALAGPLQKLVDHLKRLELSRAATQKAVSALSQIGLMIQWPFTVTIKEQEKSASGLYRIDENRLNELSDADYLELRKTGALHVAYAQLLSMANVAKLTHLARVRENISAQQKQPDFSFSNDEVFRFE